MSEVEKMYENCNIKPKQKGYCGWDSNCPYPHHKCNDECPYWKYEDIAEYPPFTAEKQLSLIMWLCQKNITDYNIINYFEGKYYCLYAWEEGFKESDLFEKYEEALACLLNYIWQDLTKEERKQIRGILE